MYSNYMEIRSEWSFFLPFFLFPLSFLLSFAMSMACRSSKFPGKGSNLCHSSNPSHSTDKAKSLTCWATRDFPAWFLIFRVKFDAWESCMVLQLLAESFLYFHILTSSVHISSTSAITSISLLGGFFLPLDPTLCPVL